jgi:hypothetical protein
VARTTIIQPPAQGQLSRGRLHIYWSDKWQRWIVRSWPKGNGGETPKRKAVKDEFSRAVAMIKNAADLDVVNAYRVTPGTRFLPRDALMLAAYGKLIEWETTDGVAWMGVRVAQSQIETLLKSISGVEGAILTVVNGDWVALLPGTANYVLTINAATGRPEWLPATGGGGGGITPVFGDLALGGPQALSANYISCVPVVAPGSMTINSVGMVFAAASATANWAVGVYDDSGNLPTNLLSQSAPQTGWAAGPTTQAALAAGVPVTAGQKLWLAFWTDTAFTANGAGYSDRVYLSWSSSTLKNPFSGGTRSTKGLSLLAVP